MITRAISLFIIGFRTQANLCQSHARNNNTQSRHITVSAGNLPGGGCLASPHRSSLVARLNAALVHPSSESSLSDSDSDSDSLSDSYSGSDSDSDSGLPVLSFHLPARQHGSVMASCGRYWKTRVCG